MLLTRPDTHFVSSKQFAATLSTPLSDPAQEKARHTNVEVFLRWTGETLALNPFLRREMNIEFFAKHPTELLSAVLENPSLTQDVLKLALADLPTLTNTKEGGSDHLQRLLGEQSSQHGAIELLLDMNHDVDDLLESLEADLSDARGVVVDDADLASINDKIIDSRTLSSQAFLRSTSYANHLVADLSNQDLTKTSSQKALAALRGSIVVDHFCLQQLCVLLANTSAKPLSLWLLDVLAADPTVASKLWLMQDHVLLTKVASKYANFFRAYLYFLVSCAEQNAPSEILDSPTWYSSAKPLDNAFENIKRRIRALEKNPRLAQPTKTFLSEKNLLNILDYDS